VLERIRIILFVGTKVALIKRTFNDEIYYVFPGGRKEVNETNLQALAREVKEELGVEITNPRLILCNEYLGQKQYFYFCNDYQGEFGSGVGEEYTELTSKRGLYEPLFVDVNELATLDIRPKEVATIIIEEQKKAEELQPFQFLWSSV
jgi:ADP-ribose pyrophosphatase